MSNKVYISNKLARIKGKEAAAKELEKIAKKEMLWGIKKDREKEEQNKDKENE